MVAEGVEVLAAAPSTKVITASQDVEVDLVAALKAGTEGELETFMGILRKKKDDNFFFQLWPNLIFYLFFATPPPPPPPTMLFDCRFTSPSDTKSFFCTAHISHGIFMLPTVLASNTPFSSLDWRLELVFLFRHCLLLLCSSKSQNKMRFV